MQRAQVRSARCRTVRCGAGGRAAYVSRIRPWSLRGKRLAVGPYCAIFKIFLFPDRDGALQCVNQPTAGIECSCAVSRKNRNQDAALANLEATQPMHDGNVANGELCASLGGEILQ